MTGSLFSFQHFSHRVQGGAYTGGEGGEAMKLDRRALDRLLAMNDAQLGALVNKLAKDYGLDLSALSVREGDLAGLRHALRTASDEQLLDLTRNLRDGR